MNETQPVVSVIVRTLAEARRRKSLLRAISSVLSQEGVTALPIVVANGTRFDRSLLDELKARRDVRYRYHETGGLPEAMRQGRTMVETPFFCFLDDDDEFLPHAMRIRVEEMNKSDDIDVVVGNGIRFLNGVRGPSAGNIEAAKRDPLGAMLENNWLAPCGALFRASRIDVNYFRDAPDFGEWTYLAYKLCLTRKIVFVNNPSYIMNDTAGSVSKSADYAHFDARLMEHILDLPLPSRMRRALRERYGAVLHTISSSHLDKHNLKDAWRYHLRSLLQPGGLRYAAYSRKLLGW